MIMVSLNFGTYLGTRLITDSKVHYDFTCSIDNMIPLWPVFVIFYVLAYVQWVVGYVRIGMENKRFCYQIMYGECIAKLITLGFFLLLPTTMVRPELTGHDPFSYLLKFIYLLDEPNNLFPSIHCIESIVCMRAALLMKDTPNWFRWTNVVMTIGVCMSTVLVKQHVVADIVGAIVIVEIGLQAGKYLFRNVDMQN